MVAGDQVFNLSHDLARPRDLETLRKEASHCMYHPTKFGGLSHCGCIDEISYLLHVLAKPRDQRVL